MSFAFSIYYDVVPKKYYRFVQCMIKRRKRLSLDSAQAAHQAVAYPGFCSMKRLGVFLLPPGLNASPS